MKPWCMERGASPHSSGDTLLNSEIFRVSLAAGAAGSQSYFVKKQKTQGIYIAPYLGHKGRLAMFYM